MGKSIFLADAKFEIAAEAAQKFTAMCNSMASGQQVQVERVLNSLGGLTPKGYMFGTEELMLRVFTCDVSCFSPTWN